MLFDEIASAGSRIKGKIKQLDERRRGVPDDAPAAAVAPVPAPMTTVAEELAIGERAGDAPIPVPESFPEPWASSLRLALDQMHDVDERYCPTSFWQPAVRWLIRDLEANGIETFKSWRSSAFYFYPKYGKTLSYAQIDQVMPTLLATAPRFGKPYFHNFLVGSTEVDRDIDVAMALLDTEKLPLDLTQAGESTVGKMPQAYRRFGADGPTVGRPFLNYALIMAALSRHLDRPIKSAIEIGAGFGALGELLKQTDPAVQYVDLDIPPLSVFAHYYLSTVFPDTKILSNLDIERGEKIVLGEGQPSACISSWHLPLVTGETDLFVNSFSFQEMEPDVVRNYAAQIARLGARYVVSLNSRAGKPLAAESSVGVVEQVKSDFIRETFETLGYTTLLRGGRPMAPPQAELLILKRT